MRRAILGIVVVLASAGCSATPSDEPGGIIVPIFVEPSPSPFNQVRAGQVRAIVPDGWDAVPAATDALRGGFLASPRPDAWRRMDGSISGMAATWVDATLVGVPSDFYYLAATGPLLARLTQSDACRPETQEVYLNNRPSFAAGAADSPGDYMARGAGTCHVGAHPTRWEYFVAAPGFGPVRRVGIPESGLYVVVAVMPDSARAPSTLRRLIAHTTFAGSSVNDFVSAAGRPLTEL